MWEYPAKFSDKFGSEITTITNDGVQLRMTLRGVTFKGPSFDFFEPLPNTNPDLLHRFEFGKFGSLIACEIECIIPLSMLDNGRPIEGSLKTLLRLGRPKANNALDYEELFLTLSYSGQSLNSSGKSGFFEDEMLELQRQLPSHASLRSCITCAFSDYSPYGHGLFGDLTCFRNSKQEYLAVKNKRDLFAIWNLAAGQVQETYLCSEYKERNKGTGYRG